MEFQTNHELVGKSLEAARGLDLGTLYPVINNDRIIIGVFSAEFGTPASYKLDNKLQAYVPETSVDAD